MSTPQVTIYPARTVRTMDPARPTAAAVAVVEDRVRAVGSLEELSSYPNTRVDDRYADSVLFPGFVEAHTHPVGGALWEFVYVGYYDRMSPDGRVWPGCTSVAAIIERLQEAERDLPTPDTPLVAWGLDPIYFPEPRLDRRALDQVSRTRYMVVNHVSGHGLTANSALLRADGITADIHLEGVVKDEHGEPTGELRETAMGLIRSVPPMLSPGLKESTLWNFAADARNHGVTTLVDLGGLDLMDDSAIRRFHSVVDDPGFSARISMFQMGAWALADLPEPSAIAARIAGLRGAGSAKLRFGHIKFVLDGSIQGFTARLQAPGYLPDDREGIWLLAPEEFAERFQLFHDAGLTVHVHCNGDEATELFLDTVERALERHPRWDHRHTVTHSQLSTPAQYRRMATLGMCANIFSNHLYYWGDQHRELTLGPDRASRMDAAATALRSGVPISLHCDTPVTPLDALATASYAAARKTASGQVLGEYERISVPDALHAMTLGAAYMLKMDHEVGSIEAGKFADFAVLDQDPWTAEADQLRDIEVAGSVVGGLHFTNR